MATARSARTALLGALAAWLLSVAVPAGASTRWQRLADPFDETRNQLHAQALQAQQQRGALFAALIGEQALEGALRAIEAAGVPERADPVLEFDCADLLTALERHEPAIAVYERAVRRWPGSPRAIDALLALAFAHAKLDRSERELHYYRAYLRAASRPWGLATATMNMAEAQMRLGRLDEAVSGYREAHRLASQRAGSGSASDTAALAGFGLAVALDRQGDPRQAEHEMAQSLALDPELRLLTASPNVFFVPAYERAFYIGLAFETKARHTEASARELQQLGRQAVGAYRDYLRRANANDLWVRRVREREQELILWLRRRGVQLPAQSPESVREPEPEPEFTF